MPIRSKNILLLGALALQIVAISAASSSQTVAAAAAAAAASGKQKQRPASDDNGRHSRLTEGLKASSPNEFRARTLMVLGGQSSGNDRQRPAEIRRQDGGVTHEQWNGPGGFGMVPTFTDQEQGDEMVALASDHSPHQVDSPPPPQADHLLEQQQQQQPQQAKRPASSKGGLSREKFLVPTAAAAAEGKLSRLNNLQDEYEDDDEAADEPEPSAATAVTSGRLAGLTSSAGSQLATDYEPPMGQQLQQLQQQQMARDRGQRAKEASAGQSSSSSNKFRPVAAAAAAAANALHYTDYVPASQYGASSGESKPVNRSVAQGERIRPLASAADGWTPSGQPAPQSSAASHDQQPQQQPSKASDGKAADKQAPSSSVGERLAGFFGSREGLNKADVAIEYLRNILKSKQSQMNNSSSSAESTNSPSGGSGPSSSGSEMGANMKSANERSYERISLLTSRLNRILNATASSQSANNSSPAAAMADPTRLAGGHSAEQPIELLSNKAQAVADLMSGAKGANQRASAGGGTKFSISDAKSTTSLDLLTRQQQQQQQQMFTTKLPGEQAFASESQQQQFQPADNLRAAVNYATPEQQFSSSAGPVNGTPLGGDYIEALDDYPRFVQEQHRQQAFPQQQQQQQLAMLESQSQLVPIKMEPPPPPIKSHEQQAAEKSSQGQQPEQQMVLPPAEAFFTQQQQQQQPRQHESRPRYHFQQVQQQQQQQQQGLGPQSVREDSRAQPMIAALQRPTADSKPDGGSRQSFESGFPETGRKQGTNPIVYQTQQQQQQPEAANQSEAFGGAGKDKHEPEPHSEAAAAHKQLEQTLDSQRQQQHHNSISSSKIYGPAGANYGPQPGGATAANPAQQQQPQPLRHHHPAPLRHGGSPMRDQHQPQQQQQQQQQAKHGVKPPKIVSYNYFEPPSAGESGEGELLATNYQLADALYSSSGGMEHLLSSAELEAIQSQFLTAEHPIVPLPAGAEQVAPANQQRAQAAAAAAAIGGQNDASLAGLLASLKPEDYPPEAALQKVHLAPEQAAARHHEEALKELASSDQPISIVALPSGGPQVAPQNGYIDNGGADAAARANKPTTSGVIKQQQQQQQQLDLDVNKKKKSLIVYLNHPRATDMTKVEPGSDGYNNSPPDQPAAVESFVSAKEFDSHGLSKDTKHLDVSNLRGFEDSLSKEEKDGLSVVVIGDAYKYKKIVLLISSKSGGLKFIPMVKDMKK